MTTESMCPFSGSPRKQAVAGASMNATWWPNQLNLKLLNQNSPRFNPMEKDFDTPRSSRASTLRPSKKTSAR